MRISSRESDDGYEAYEALALSGMNVTVVLDGKMIPYGDAVTADEQRGLVEVLIRDEDGTPMKTHTGHLATRFVTGEVKVFSYLPRGN